MIGVIIKCVGVRDRHDVVHGIEARRKAKSRNMTIYDTLCDKTIYGSKHKTNDRITCVTCLAREP